MRMIVSASNVLFLGFDGVLHAKRQSPKEYLEDRHLPFAFLPALEDGLRDGPVAIVLTTTWVATYPMDELLDMLGPHIAPRVVDTLPPHALRAAAILAYVQTKAINDWFALDDEVPVTWPGYCEPQHGLLTPGVLPALRQWLEVNG